MMEGGASLGGRKSGPLFCLWLCLCLASALVHALIPLDAPSISGTGSAFSASTSAVAIKPSGSSVAEQEAVPSRKDGPWQEPADLAGQFPPSLAAAILHLPGTDATAPWDGRGRARAGGIRSSPALARAPPLS